MTITGPDEHRDDWPVIDGFVLEAAIGQGSAGRVYRARDPHGAPVAIKVLGRSQDPKAGARFERELEAVRRLQHPHIIEVLGSGVCADGAPYIVQELVEGQPLDVVLPGLEPARAIRILAQVARTLEYGHRLGVVHRDVKPANVVVDAHDRPRILDFGLATVAGFRAVTSASALIGSPDFVPPEVVLGRVPQAGPPGDAYALGVILYELLSGGIHPFPGCSSFPQFLTAMSGAEPASPSEASGRVVPAQLEAICTRALDKVPTSRLSCGELAAALEAWLSNEAPESLAAPEHPQLEHPGAAPTEVVRFIRELVRPARPQVPLLGVLRRLMVADLDLGRLLDLVLDLVLEGTGACEGFVLVADSEGRLAVERARGLDSDSLPPGLCTSILAEVRRTGVPVISFDAGADDRFAQRESVIAMGLRSVACVPILDPVDRMLLGAVYLQDRRRAGRFGTEIEGFLRDLAALVAGPVKRARQFEAERAARAAAQVALEDPTSGVGRRLIGRSPALVGMLRMISRVATSDAPVLIQGESGSGKELAARLIHERSGRRDAAFVAVDCGALPETLLESELFGVTQGAFTGADRDRPGLFQLASGGTLFLDEVAEMSPACQAKLLRAAQEGEVRPVGAAQATPVDVRLVTASHRDLGQLVEQGTFRQDLFYRLNVIPLRVPPLRERLEDVPLLVQHFLDELSATRGETVGLPAETVVHMSRQRWPGNVRELRNAVLRAVTLGPEVRDRDRDSSGPARAITVDLGQWQAIPGIREARVHFDRVFLRAVLDVHGGNITRAAETLGLQRSNLSRLLKRLDIPAAAPPRQDEPG